MSEKNWIMNCILVGAGAMYRLEQEDENTARMILEGLTSELKPEDINYLLLRLKDIRGK